MTAPSDNRYRWRDGALLRVSTDPGTPGVPRDLDMTGERAAEDGAAWLAGIWRTTALPEAIALTSPVLHAQVDKIVNGPPRSARDVRRTVLAVVGYLLRWQQRPTPFGLFAGVTAVRVGGGPPEVRWGEHDRLTVRPDAQWLSTVTDRFERRPDILEGVFLQAVPELQVRGDRYVVAAQGTAEEISVRRGGAVALAVAAARRPIPYRRLRDLLSEQRPGTAPDRVDALLYGLVDCGVLVSSLRAPMTVTDPLEHLCTELEQAASDEAAVLRGVHRRLATEPPRAVLGEMAALCSAPAVPLAIDAAVDGRVRIPEAVAQEAEGAAEALIRLSPHPFGSPAWRDYHGRFRARYGSGTVVPLLELVADSGLGLPAGYPGSPWKRTAGQLTARDEHLLALLQRAHLEGRDEIVLTDRLIDQLAAEPARALPDRIEIAVAVHAPSTDALARGDFRLTVTGTPRPGSSMAGRFAHLLAAEDRAAIGETFAGSRADTIAAQLSFPPRSTRSGNITRTGRLLPHVIPLGEHHPPGPGVIELTDIGVTADRTNFQLIRMSSGRLIEPRVPHALEPTHRTPPLARFLAEITHARSAVYRSFDFGAAARLPYLPRVRYRRTTLAEARWLLDADDLPPAATPVERWSSALTAWRARLRVPERVVLADHDQRLRLDLTHPVHRLFLRRRLNAARRLHLREAPAEDATGWLGRPHELLIPLRLTAPRPTPRVGTVSRPGGTTALAAQIHGHPDRYDEILLDWLPVLLRDLDPAPWWFTRQRAAPRPDADSLLLLTLPLREEEEYGRTAGLVNDWAGLLRARHLVGRVLVTSEAPPDEPTGLTKVFAADSAAALAQLRLAARGAFRREAIAAAGLLRSYGVVGPARLLEALPHDPVPVDRTFHDEVRVLSGGAGSFSGSAEIEGAWAARGAALTECEDASSRLPALIRAHIVRALGPERAVHRTVCHLVRAGAQRLLATGASP
ncbi:lantibiotic dehydratase family protein [Streptomyces harbinensis]|uniref:lantibiotic dehydratase family protein n=1 Tax=Streptomyces harbinensis TaxID=1176198 RepID=UPI003720C792